MGKNIGLFWLKDDFRIKKNLALFEATKNHDQVVAFYLYKKQKFDHQEAQKQVTRSRWYTDRSIQTLLDGPFPMVAGNIHASLDQRRGASMLE